MQKPIIKIHRHWQDHKQTLGSCVVLDLKGQPIFSALSLERGWKDNRRNISCYPKGVYELSFDYSQRFRKYLWEVKNIPGRSECKFHAANHWHQLNGCTSLGIRPKDIDKDGYIDITSSRRTMDDFHYALRGFSKAILIVTSDISIC